MCKEMAIRDRMAEAALALELKGDVPGVAKV